MQFINFTVVKFSICLVLGILTAYLLPISIFILPYLLILLSGIFILWIAARKQIFQNAFFGIAVYCCFFSIGYSSYQIKEPTFQPNHYSHTNEAGLVQLKIIQNQKPDKYNVKYLARVTAINGQRKTGKIMLIVAKDSSSILFASDETLMVYAPISKIPHPLNPHQFDYSKYMESIGVYGQIRISKEKILKRERGKPTLTGIAQNFRRNIVNKLENTKLKTDERAIIQALVLGEKKDIGKNLYNEYAAAGAVHILAVSGLHVGILYLILAFLFKPIKIGKFGMYLHAAIIVCLLWGFAVLSGLSPSVTRAVTMFSFFAMAKIFNRETSTLNTLFLSFFVLLAINPLWLFQVGFQMSYLAVFFIVWLQPIFYGVGHSKYSIVRKAWTVLAVTLSAQIGVLPLSLYYFHQFPGLFLLTNIMVLPFLAVLMCGGIMVVILAALEILPNWLAKSYNYIIEGLNGFIHWIAAQEKFLFKDIHFSGLKVLGAYLLIIALALFLKKINSNRLVASLLAISIFISIFIYDEIKTSANQFVVFQKSKATLIGYKNGKDFTLFTSGSPKNDAEDYPIKSYKTAINIESHSEKKLPEIFQYNHKMVLIIDSLGVYPKHHKKIHTVVLINSPKINLNRMIDSLEPKQIVANGSNYFSYAKRWEKTCNLKKLPFSYTAKQGAFSLK